MSTLVRSVLRKSTGLYLRRAGVDVSRAGSLAFQLPVTNTGNFSQRRFNSTTPSDSGAESTTSIAASIPMEATVDPSLLNLVNEAAVNVAVAEQHSNFVIRGVMEMIDSVHNLVGIPYWEAIVATTIGLRLLMVPVAIKTTQSTARLAHLRPVLQSLSDSMKNDPRAADSAVKMRYQKEIQAAFVKYKVNPLHAMFWPMAQIPFFLSIFFAVQGMGTYYPGFATGGAFWFTDLNAADATYIFPILNSLSFLAMIEFMSQEGVQMQQSAVMKNVLRGLAVVTLPLTATMPQSVFVFWTTNNAISLAQGLALKNKTVKKALDIPDMPTGAEVPDLKISSPLSKLKAYMATKKDAEANARAEILDGVSKPNMPISPPPKTSATPPPKKKTV